MSERDVNKRSIEELFKMFPNPSIDVNEVFLVRSDPSIHVSPIDMYLETSPYINRSRGSGRNEYEMTGNEETSTEACNSVQKKLSFSDADFLDAGAGIEMIMKDQEQREKELTLQIANSDVTACSLWVPTSAKRLSVLSMSRDNDILKNQSNVSVGEYIAIRSEALGSLSDYSKCSNMFLGLATSTPCKGQTDMLSNDMTIRDANERSVHLTPRISLTSDSTLFHGSNLLCPTFLYTVTPKNKDREYSNSINHCYIGDTCLKNIERVKAKERELTKNSIGKLSKDQSDFESKSGDSSTCSYDTVFMKSSSSTNSLRRGSVIITQWKVEPQEIVLNPAKGNRVALINYSVHDLKFKAKFDGNVISVSPSIGTVSAKSEIGLRITVIRTAKNSNEYFEDVIRLICGNSEKIIKIQILKEEKFKPYVKERSYQCF